MKSIELWSREARQLSTLEKVYLKDAIEALLSWEPFKKDYGELDLIRRMLEGEVRLAEYTGEHAGWFAEERSAVAGPDSRCLRKSYAVETAPCSTNCASDPGTGRAR
jgi:hypothetical protein